MAASCVHGNEPFYSVKVGEFLDQPSDHQILKKHAAAWCELAYVQEELRERIKNVNER